MNFGLGEFYSIACALVWAIAVILFKKSGESLPPVALNLFKNMVGLLLMAVTVFAVTGTAVPELPPAALALTLFSGFLGIGVGDTLFFRALNAIGASRMGIAQTLYSPFVIVLSAAFLAERLGLLQLLGVMLVLSGVMLVNYTREAAVDALAIRRGVMHAALAVFAMAAGIVIAKPLLERYDFLWVVTLRIVGGTLGLLLFVALRSESAKVWNSFRTVRHWPQVIAGSILGTYVSMLLWLAGYKYTSASVAAVLNEMAAVFIIVLAAIFLDDRMRRTQLLGSAVALAGVLFVVWR
jgi:drug/metabolite transporter (DMT)-like permease